MKIKILGVATLALSFLMATNIHAQAISGQTERKLEENINNALNQDLSRPENMQKLQNAISRLRGTVFGEWVDQNQYEEKMTTRREQDLKKLDEKIQNSLKTELSYADEKIIGDDIGILAANPEYSEQAKKYQEEFTDKLRQKVENYHGIVATDIKIAVNKAKQQAELKQNVFKGAINDRINDYTQNPQNVAVIMPLITGSFGVQISRITKEFEADLKQKPVLFATLFAKLDIYQDGMQKVADDVDLAFQGDPDHDFLMGEIQKTINDADLQTMIVFDQLTLFANNTMHNLFQVLKDLQLNKDFTINNTKQSIDDILTTSWAAWAHLGSAKPIHDEIRHAVVNRILMVITGPMFNIITDADLKLDMPNKHTKKILNQYIKGKFKFARTEQKFSGLITVIFNNMQKMIDRAKELFNKSYDYVEKTKDADQKVSVALIGKSIYSILDLLLDRAIDWKVQMPLYIKKIQEDANAKYEKVKEIAL